MAAKGGTQDADLSSIRIIRDNQVIKHNLAQILERSEPIPTVSGGDIIQIGRLEHDLYKTKASRDQARIFGAIQQPGGYVVTKESNLIDLITEAGGETQFADLSRIVIYHPQNDSEIFNLNNFLRGDSSGGTELLPKISNGDVVHISHRQLEGYTEQETVTVTGSGCNQSGFYPFKHPMTVIKAVARAGGLNDFADSDHIQIIRRVSGKQENISYSYDNGIRGNVPEVNILLRPGDVVYVP